MSILVIQLLTESELIFCSSRKLNRTEQNQKKFLSLITPYYACVRIRTITPWTK